MVDEALLVRLTASPPPELFPEDASPQERLARLQEFYSDLKAHVRARLANEAVEITDLESMGALIVYGEPSTLERLRGPGGPLDIEGIVVDDDTSFAVSPAR